MDVIRITETCSDIQNRETYKFLENLNCFSLLDCAHATDLQKLDCAEVLVLDHLDQAQESSKLLSQVIALGNQISTLILVDSNRHFSLPAISRLQMTRHFIFHSPPSEPLNLALNQSQHRQLHELIHRNKENAA